MAEKVPTITPEPEKTETIPEDVVSEVPEKESEKDRTTEQFDKLKNSNSELKKERDGYKNVLESLQPEPVKPVPSPQKNAPKGADIGEQLESMVDENGYLDGNKLKNVMQGMSDSVKRAEFTAKRVEIQARKEAEARTRSQKTAKMTEVHKKFPELDPENEKFNEEFYDSVRNEIIGQMMEGKEDPLSAAEKWHSRYFKEGGEPMAKEKENKEKTQKEQINAIKPHSSSMSGYYADEEEEALRKKVMSGKRGALAELLKRRESKK